jgi:endonuclease/exonuclease/phosphatase (EEP) superfamily protein YafD
MKILNVIFYFVAAGLVFSEFGDRFWFFDLFAHFMLQYWLAAAVLFIVFALRKNRGKAFKSAVLCLWATVHLGSAILDRAPRTKHPHVAHQLRIFEFNTQGNPEVLSHWLPIHAGNFDVIVLLEATPDFQKLVDTLTPQFPYQALGLINSPFGLAVLSRWPIVETKKFSTDAELYPQFQLRLKGEEVGEFTLFALHAPPPFSSTYEIAHKKILTELSDRLQQRKYPALVVGDLNTTSFSDRYERLMRDTGLNDTAGISPWATTWPSYFVNYLSALGIRIDHCLISTSFSLVERARLEDLGSDHLPTKIILQFEK